MYKIGILTLSDRSAAGTREDLSGPAVREAIADLGGAEVVRVAVIPDDLRLIERTLVHWADQLHLNLVLTTGGTGVSPRDITPEATTAVSDRLIPGMAEAMRSAGMTTTPFAMISRSVVGIRGRTLIINLPGSPAGARQSLAAVLPALRHVLDKINGDNSDCIPEPTDLPDTKNEKPAVD